MPKTFALFKTMFEGDVDVWLKGQGGGFSQDLRTICISHRQAHVHSPRALRDSADLRDTKSSEERGGITAYPYSTPDGAVSMSKLLICNLLSKRGV